MADKQKTKQQLIDEVESLRLKCSEQEALLSEARSDTADSTMEEGLLRYKLLLNNARDIMLFVRHSDGRIIDANTAAVKAYLYDYQQLKSLRIRDLRAHAKASEIRVHLDAANREGILFETLHRRKDGSIFPVEVNSIGITIGNERILFSIVRDITGRRENDAKIRKGEELANG